MAQLFVTVLCAFLGWRQAPFMRWPVAIILFAAVGAGLFVVAETPFRYLSGLRLASIVVSVLALPTVGYWLSWGLRAATRKSR